MSDASADPDPTSRAALDARWRGTLGARRAAPGEDSSRARSARQAAAGLVRRRRCGDRRAVAAEVVLALRHRRWPEQRRLEAVEEARRLGHGWSHCVSRSTALWLDRIIDRSPALRGRFRGPPSRPPRRRLVTGRAAPARRSSRARSISERAGRRAILAVGTQRSPGAARVELFGQARCLHRRGSPEARTGRTGGRRHLVSRRGRRDDAAGTGQLLRVLQERWFRASGTVLCTDARVMQRPAAIWGTRWRASARGPVLPAECLHCAPAAQGARDDILLLADRRAHARVSQARGEAGLSRDARKGAPGSSWPGASRAPERGRALIVSDGG